MSCIPLMPEAGHPAGWGRGTCSHPVGPITIMGFGGGEEGEMPESDPRDVFSWECVMTLVNNAIKKAEVMK